MPYTFNPLLEALLQKDAEGGGGGAGVSSLNGKTGSVYVAGALKLDQPPLYYPDRKAKQVLYSLLADTSKKKESRYAYPTNQIIAEVKDDIENIFYRTTFTYSGGEIIDTETEVITSFTIVL